jgi:cell wall-associated NlpC family hydrolase
LGNQIVQTAFQYMGVPYVWGGNTESGIDCSGYLKKVFAENGIRLPRTAREQSTVGTQVSYAELQPGDRLYFCYKNSYIDHCGIYIGDNTFIHSSASRGGVAVDKLTGRHAQALVCAMR